MPRTLVTCLTDSDSPRPIVGTEQNSTSGGPAADSRHEAAAGQALLEFALMMPLLLLVSLAIIEFGRMLTIYSLTSGAARQATRYGTAVDPEYRYYLDCDEIRQAAQRAAAPLLQLNLPGDVTIQYDNGLDGNLVNAGAQCDSITDGDLKSGDRIRVTITTSFQPLVPLVNLPPMSITYVSARTIIKKGDISTFPECRDGVDNDLDSLVDYPADPNCSSLDDNTEFAPEGTPICWPLTLAVYPSPAAGTATITSVGSPGECPPGFGAGYQEPTVVDISADPADDWIFLYWEGDTNDNSQAATTVTMDAMKTVTAHFEECFQLNVNVNAPGTGTVNQDPGEPTCPENALYRGIITLEAVPAEGKRFADWTVNGLPAGFDPVLTLKMDSDKTVVATFADTCHQVDTPPSVEPAGSPNSAAIGTDPNCDETQYANGSTILLGANADLGWIFDRWTWDMGGVQGSSPANPALLVVTGDVTNLVAHFISQCYALTTNVVPDRDPPVGTVTPDSPDTSTGCTGGKYPAGQLISLTASSSTNPFFGWTENGLPRGSNPTLPLLMNEDKDVVARFEGKLHVKNISITPLIATGNRWFVRVQVTVEDEYGAPASGVAVTGHWTWNGKSWSNDPPNPYNLTNGFGQVTFYSEAHACNPSNPCTFVYNVDDLVKTFYAYDWAADEGNPASVDAPP